MNSFCTKYIELISTEFSGLNLTRINDGPEFYEKQYLDSIIPFEKYINKIYNKITQKYKNIKSKLNMVKLLF